MAEYGGGAPSPEDERHDDLEFNPAIEPRKSLAWLNLLKESEDAFEKWNDHCDKIDKQYANLERLSTMSRDKEFQMFWANMEVVKPSIYASPPVPVVVEKFKDRMPVPQAAAELLERCAHVSFDIAHINDLMIQIRDDVVMNGRGVPWVRYESGKGGKYDHEKVCYDFKHRRDFLHSISRCWYEVTWVAAASYLTRTEARDRFKRYSGDCYQDADYKVDKDAKEVGGADARERAKFWEIWDKTSRRVCWVAEGCEDILDEDDPHHELQDFFPCPKPAYGTLQRGSLVPVPDVLQYKDQLDEINLLTSRIHALSDALEAKGFYPSGGTETADAIEAAIKLKTPGRILVPIANWAAFGGSKEVIIWLPIAEIAQTITQCVQLRQQIIQDIYQIVGLSDIMRGATDARETLGAQELKSEYGSTRIRDKQDELVRIAKDLVTITCDIITEKFDDETIIEMSQTQLPTKAQQEKQANAIAQQMQAQQQQLQQVMATPQFAQLQQQNPEQVAQLQQQAQQLQDEGEKALKNIEAQPTLDQVLTFLKEKRSRAFVLDIETDSTIRSDENGEKSRRNEFIGMLAQLLPQLAQMIMTEPQTAPFCGEMLKFATAPYRAGRSLDGAINQLVDGMKVKAQQPQGDDPTTMQAKTAKEIEQMKIAHAQQRDQQDAALKTQEMKMRDEHEKAKIASNERIKMADIQQKNRDDAAKQQQTNQKAMFDREKHQQDMIKLDADRAADQQKQQLAVEASQLKRNDMLARQDERRAAQQFKMQTQPTQGGFPA